MNPRAGRQCRLGALVFTLAGVIVGGCNNKSSARDAAAGSDGEDRPPDVVPDLGIDLAMDTRDTAPRDDGDGDRPQGDAADDASADVAADATLDLARDATQELPSDRPGDLAADLASDIGQVGDGNTDRPNGADSPGDACATPAGAPGDRCGCGACAGGGARCVTSCSPSGAVAVCTGAMADVGTCACGAFLDDRCTGGASCVCPRSCDGNGLCLTAPQKVTLCAGPLAGGFACP